MENYTLSFQSCHREIGILTPLSSSRPAIETQWLTPPTVANGSNTEAGQNKQAAGQITN